MGSICLRAVEELYKEPTNMSARYAVAVIKEEMTISQLPSPEKIFVPE